MNTQELLSITTLGILLGNLIALTSWCLPKILLADETSLRNHNLCQTHLHWTKLIPLISWWTALQTLIKQSDPAHKNLIWRYPLAEILSLLATLLTFNTFGLTLEGWLITGLLLTLILITLIDLEHHLIFDALSLPLLWAGLIINSFGILTQPSQAILGAAAGYGILWGLFHFYRILTGKEAMGYGDFKLLAALGAWLGIAALAQIIFLSALASLIIALPLIIARLRDSSQPLAYGPFLALGATITIFSGNLFF